MVKSSNIKTDPRELNIYLDYNTEFCRCLKMREALSLTKVPVHTNPLSKENGAVLPIPLSSTLQRRKRSPKMEPLKKALQSLAIWIRCFLKKLFSSVDGENDAIWKRRRHQIDTTGRQTTRPWVSKMADTRYHVSSLLISVVVWTGENDTKRTTLIRQLL